MLSELERWVFFYNTILAPYPAEAPPVELRVALKQLQKRWNSGKSHKLVDNEARAMSIMDVYLDQRRDVAVMLFSLSDTTISDPVFSNLRTRNLRLESKRPDEGLGISVHVAFSLAPLKDKPNHYVTILEDVPGLTRSRIIPFFKSELKEACTFEFNTAKSKNPLKGRPLPEMEGYPSESLKDQLKRGQLVGFQLVSEKKKRRGIDEMPDTVEVRRSVELKVSPPRKGEKALNVIERVRAWAQGNGYEEVRVKYLRNGQNGRQKTFALPAHREGIEDVLTTRFERIVLRSPMQQCVPKIRQDLANAMIAMLLKVHAGR